MKGIAGLVLALAFAATPVPNPDKQIDEILSELAARKRDCKSLVVDFSIEMRDHTLGQNQKKTGSCRVLRLPDGKIMVTLDVIENAKKERLSGLINGTGIYLLNYDKKHAIRLSPENADVFSFVQRYVLSKIALADRNKAEQLYKMEVVKRDAYYTYLSVKQKPSKVRRWFENESFDGCVVFVNDKGEDIPKFMPRQLWWKNSLFETITIIDIKKWEFDGANPPKIEEFTLPEDRPGWTVSRTSEGAK